MFFLFLPIAMSEKVVEFSGIKCRMLKRKGGFVEFEVMHDKKYIF